MSEIRVRISLYDDYPKVEETKLFSGDATIGNVREYIKTCITAGSIIDEAWVAFADLNKQPIRFGHTKTTSDAFQLKDLLFSDEPGSPVYVAVFTSHEFTDPSFARNVRARLGEQDDTPGRKRPADDQSFARSVRARLAD